MKTRIRFNSEKYYNWLLSYLGSAIIISIPYELAKKDIIQQAVDYFEAAGFFVEPQDVRIHNDKTNPYDYFFNAEYYIKLR